MKRSFNPIGLVLCLSLLLAGCKQQSNNTVDVIANSRPYLQVKTAQGYLTIQAPQLDKQYDGNITYDGVSDVCIVINEEAIPLEQAVKEGTCSIEQVIAYAQEDARNGICTEGQCTYNGLTKFTYTYPEYMLITIHDVYETPDGSCYTLNDFTVTVPKEITPSPIGYSNMTTGEYLDLEDWGVQFTPIEVTDKGIVLATNQQGGQNFGNLILTDFYLVSEPEKQFLEESQVYGLSIPIKMNDSGELQLEWNNSMPTGDYMLVVRLEEQYNKSDMPSLMRNYHDTQQYLIPIAIDETSIDGGTVITVP